MHGVMLGRMQPSPRLTDIIDDLKARLGADARPATAADVVCAVIKDGTNLGARLIESFRVELPEPALATGGDGTGALTPAAVALLATAAGVARELGHAETGPEHVVIAAADGADPVHAGMYAVLGITPPLLRRQLARLIADPSTTDVLEPEVDPAFLDHVEAELHRLADEARS
jgi:hypothetical protein